MKSNGCDIVNRINSVLNDKNVNQQALADYAQISIESFTEWKTQNNIPAADIIFVIAHFLGVSVQYLLTGNANHIRHDLCQNRHGSSSIQKKSG